MSYNNLQLARILEDFALRSEMSGGSPFRFKAYQKAADTIKSLSSDIEEMSKDEGLELDGIGEGTWAFIEEWRENGVISEFEELKSSVPDGVVELTKINGLGTKTAMRLYKELDVKSIGDLAGALTEGRVEELPRMGKKSVDKLKVSLHTHLNIISQGYPVADCIELEEYLHQQFKNIDKDCDSITVGDWRKGLPSVKVLEFLVATDKGKDFLSDLSKNRHIQAVITEEDDFLLFRMGNNIPVAISICSHEDYGLNMLHTTGPEGHVSKVLDRAGSLQPDLQEGQIYANADLPFIKPTLRDIDNIISLADNDSIPKVVEVEDLKGDLHGHSSWSGDGTKSLKDMALAAKEIGLSYWAATDHAENLRINGISEKQILQRREELKELGDSLGIYILDGSELNIGTDGNIDYNDDILSAFEWTVASVHSSLDKDEVEQTKRILSAIENPYVNCIGHLHGRKIGQRKGFDVELKDILQACKETGTALEINAHPRRLDIDAPIIKQALKEGVTMTISCDAHDLKSLTFSRFGVMQAQRALVAKDSILNCKSLDEVQAFVQNKRDKLL